MTTRLSTIMQIALTVQDLDRAVAFYRDSLGLALLFQAPPRLAFFDCDGIRLMLAEPEPGSVAGPSGAVLYFKVDDIQATHRALIDRGVEFTGVPHLIAKMPDHDLWLAEFRDTEGNRFALMSEVRSRDAPV